MAMPTPAQMIAKAQAEFDKAYEALGDAGDWLRSDWSHEPTPKQARQIQRMREGIAAAKTAITQGR